MRLSVCIPTLNRPSQVEALLKNLSVQKQAPDDVVIVDASSDQRTFSIVRRYEALFRKVSYEVSERGLTRQRNRAVALATGDILLFLDDDVLLEPAYGEEIMKIFCRDEAREIGGVTGVQTNLAEVHYGLGWRFKERIGVIETRAPGRMLACGETTALPRRRFEGVCYVDHLPGGLTAWRREVFKDYSYDTFFKGYGLGEDKNFSVAVGKRYRLAVCGTALAEHLHVDGNRPSDFRYGYDNIVNHFYTLINCVDRPLRRVKFFLFHAIDVVNDLLAWPFGMARRRRLCSALGRMVGLARVMILPLGMRKSSASGLGGTRISKVG